MCSIAKARFRWKNKPHPRAHTGFQLKFLMNYHAARLPFKTGFEMPETPRTTHEAPKPTLTHPSCRPNKLKMLGLYA